MKRVKSRKPGRVVIDSPASVEDTIETFGMSEKEVDHVRRLVDEIVSGKIRPNRPKRVRVA